MADAESASRTDVTEQDGTWPVDEAQCELTRLPRIGAERSGAVGDVPKSAPTPKPADVLVSIVILVEDCAD